MLKIGYMEYANVYPIFHRLLKNNRYVFKKGFPAMLNLALRNGEIDVSPSSSIEYARHPDLYRVVDGVSVSSVGPVKSVNLFSRFGVDNLSGRRVYFTKESNTSTVLCRIILEKFYGAAPIYTDDETMLDAVLLIGDKALKNYYADAGKTVIDLGAEWHRFTGLPFVFALWTARKESAEKPEFKEFYEELKKAAAESPLRWKELVPRYESEGYTEEQITDYWNTIDYRLSEKHLEGLRLFYKLAAEIGEIPAEPPVRFA